MTFLRPMLAILVALVLAACSASNKGQMEVTEDGEVVTKVHSRDRKSVV